VNCIFASLTKCTQTLNHTHNSHLYNTDNIGQAAAIG